MNKIEINNTDLAIKEYDGKRVVTFKDIDEVHQRPEGTARKRFNDNKKHFIEGEDFYIVKPKDFQMSEKRTSGNFELNNRGTTLITETGYLMLVKSFTDDLAWTVQRELVNRYFKGNNDVMLMLERINLSIQNLSDRLDRLENNNIIDTQLKITSKGKTYKDEIYNICEKIMKVSNYSSINAVLSQAYGIWERTFNMSLNDVIDRYMEEYNITVRPSCIGVFSEIPNERYKNSLRDILEDMLEEYSPKTKESEYKKYLDYIMKNTNIGLTNIYKSIYEMMGDIDWNYYAAYYRNRNNSPISKIKIVNSSCELRSIFIKIAKEWADKITISSY